MFAILSSVYLFSIVLNMFYNKVYLRHDLKKPCHAKRAMLWPAFLYLMVQWFIQIHMLNSQFMIIPCCAIRLSCHVFDFY